MEELIKIYLVLMKEYLEHINEINPNTYNKK
jgi:hypothetical protein